MYFPVLILASNGFLLFLELYKYDQLFVRLQFAVGRKEWPLYTEIYPNVWQLELMK